MGRRDRRVRRGRIGGESIVVVSVPVAPDAASLTAAERAILQLLLTGASNREIAARRGTALATVVNQVSAVFRKLCVRSRAELALAAAR
jgi:DNA-binding NarL/FixJ family response regulator